MKIYNKTNTYSTDSSKALKSYLLIGKWNNKDTNISILYSRIPIKSEQPLHNHKPEQCYFIIKGKGKMIIEDEESIVDAGDAVYISSNKTHRIINIGWNILLLIL